MNNNLNKIKYFISQTLLNLINLYKFIKKYIYILLLVIVLIFFLCGFHIINKNENGIVKRFGKLYKIEYPGINWNVIFVDKIKKINIYNINKIYINNNIFTSDKNLIELELTINYKINDLNKYLLRINNSYILLEQLLNKIILELIGKNKIDFILNKKDYIKINLLKEINKIIKKKYNIGITIIDINIKNINVPKELDKYFINVNNSIKNKEKYIEKAIEYKNKMENKSNIEIEKIILNSKYYEFNKILKAEDKIKYLKKILLIYKKNPEFIKNKLYFDLINKILKNKNKSNINKNK